MKISGLLTDFRKWLDGEDAVSSGPLSQQQQLSEWDEFFVIAEADSGFFPSPEGDGNMFWITKTS